MTAKAILLTVIVLLSLFFALFNLEALTATSRLDLLVTEASLPLGLVLLIALVVLSVLHTLLALVTRARHLKQLNDYEKQLSALRDDLEGARFAELERIEARIGERLNRMEGYVAGVGEGIEDRLRSVQTELDERILRVRNEVVADIAELRSGRGQAAPEATLPVTAPRLGREYKRGE